MGARPIIASIVNYLLLLHLLHLLVLLTLGRLLLLVLLPNHGHVTGLRLRRYTCIAILWQEETVKVLIALTEVTRVVNFGRLALLRLLHHVARHVDMPKVH